MDEQAAKGEPIRGRRYMIFTLIAMLILTIIVGMNANITALEKIRDEKLHQAMTSGVNKKEEKPTLPADSDKKEEPEAEVKKPEAKEEEKKKVEEPEATEKAKETAEGEKEKKEDPAEEGK